MPNKNKRIVPIVAQFNPAVRRQTARNWGWLRIFRESEMLNIPCPSEFVNRDLRLACPHNLPMGGADLTQKIDTAISG